MTIPLLNGRACRLAALAAFLLIFAAGCVRRDAGSRSKVSRSHS